MPKTVDHINDKEWADYLTGVLKRLDALAESLPENAALRQFIGDACEPLSTLIGYFVGGIVEDTTPPTEQEMECLKTFKTALKQRGLAHDD